MLAKQLWRIWSYPEKLLSRVLKARYFPRSDVFSASLGTRPSFTWRSVMAAQSLFRKGCRWRVGTGEHIRAWDDPWLPRPRSFKPITPAPVVPANLFVADLVTPDGLDWDVVRVRELFWPEDSEVILGLPLSRTREPDLLVWHYSKNGRFSVRSAYHLACLLDDRPGSSSLGEHESSWWRKVWQSKIPNKIKVFVWRACLNALPTSANLHRRIQGFQAGCPLCCAEKEDVMHVLALCPFARQAWGLSSFRSCLLVSGSGDTLKWMQGVALGLDSQELSLFFFSGRCGGAGTES
ncbi:UNVERIFIED_CONTAM: putative mitochondrial protein [Sesamum radiatum]|uniref:Mitochondrial protein n=1 Tax=Sesamum radiatum TaxID=300843 RepID=A0AAW2NPV3_SESRA